MDSIIIDEVLECEDLNKQVEEVQDLEKAAEKVKWHEDIKTKRNYKSSMSSRASF